MTDAALPGPDVPQRTRRLRRARRLAVALAAALVGGVGGGLLASNLFGDDGIDVRLEKPGEYPIPAPERKSQAGQRFPDVEVLDVDGSPVQTGSMVGRPLIVNVWYSSCLACLRALPEFAAVQQQYRGVVRFVGINPVDDIDTMVAVAAGAGVVYELYRDHEIRFIETISPVGYPITLFVAADGTVVEQTGEIDADGLRSRIAAMLADGRADG